MTSQIDNLQHYVRKEDNGMNRIEDLDVQRALTAVEKPSSRKSTPLGTVIEIPFGKFSAINPNVGKLSLLPEIRYMMQRIGLNESRLTGLRLEHKLLHNILLRNYCPDAFPTSVGLSEALENGAGEDPADRLAKIFPEGFCIKAALGAGSPRGVVDSRNLSILAEIRSGQLLLNSSNTVLEEKWIVQARIDVDVEYRVHTLEDRVISRLTYRYRNTDLELHRAQAEAFVVGVLRRLPAGLIKDSFCGWDIALTKDNRFMVIEINYAGLHTVYRPGYQCSGSLENGPKSPANFALLVAHVQREYGLDVRCLYTQADSGDSQSIYFRKVDWWLRLLRIEDLVDSLTSETKMTCGVSRLGDLNALGHNSVERMYFRNLRGLSHEIEKFMFPSDW
jgi:hypothetical protein